MLSAFYLLFSKKKKEEKVENDAKDDVLELPMPKSPVARSFICTFGNEASLVRGACSVKLNDVDDDSYDSSIAHSSESFQKRKIYAQNF